MQARGDLRGLEVVLTAGCNLACSYCYENAKDPSRRMDAETLRAAVDLLAASPRPEVSLTFYGGEPLLRFDAIRETVAYADTVRPPGKEIRYEIVTNGTLLDEEKSAFLARHRFRTQLSFDGLPAAQEFRGAGTFAKLDALLVRLRARHRAWFDDDVHVAVTLLPATLGGLADSVAYLISRGVRRLRVSPATTAVASWNVDDIADLERAMARIYEITLAEYERSGDVVFEDFRRSDRVGPHAPRGRSMCGVATGETLAVDTDGRVYGCVTFVPSYQKFVSPLLKAQIEPLGLGSIHGGEVAGNLPIYRERARFTPIFARKQDKYSSYARCGSCRFLDTCSLCPIAIGHVPGNADPNRVPDFHCAWNLVTLAWRERFPAQGCLPSDAPLTASLAAIRGAASQRRRARN